MGGGLAPPVPPHHRTYGSVSGGSPQCCSSKCLPTSLTSPFSLNHSLLMASFACGLRAMSHQPQPLPPSLRARQGGTPRLTSNTVTDRPRCFSRTQRSFRRIHLSIRSRCTFAFGFLQIPPHDGHPCPRLYGSVLSPPVRDSHSRHRACLAHSKRRARPRGRALPPTCLQSEDRRPTRCYRREIANGVAKLTTCATRAVDA